MVGGGGPQSKPRSGLLASPSITKHSNFSVKMCFIFLHISTRLDESASQSGQGFERHERQSDTDSLQGLNTRGQAILLICGENWMNSVFCPSAKQGSARYQKRMAPSAPFVATLAIYPNAGKFELPSVFFLF